MISSPVSEWRNPPSQSAQRDLGACADGGARRQRGVVRLSPRRILVADRRPGGAISIPGSVAAGGAVEVLLNPDLWSGRGVCLAGRAGLRASRRVHGTVYALPVQRPGLFEWARPDEQVKYGERIVELWRRAGFRLDGRGRVGEANLPPLDCAKARSQRDWRPLPDLSEALQQVVAKNRSVTGRADARSTRALLDACRALANAAHIGELTR